MKKIIPVEKLEEFINDNIIDDIPFTKTKEYADILSKLTVGGNDTGDYAGDWADAYIKVFFK